MELHIEKSYQTRRMNFYAFSDGSHRKVAYTIVDGEFQECLTDINSAEIIAPILSLPINLGEDFINGIAKFASSNGIQTENENLLKGKLIATENHLQDMQLAFNTLLSKIRDRI